MISVTQPKYLHNLYFYLYFYCAYNVHSVTNPTSRTGRDPVRSYIFDLVYGIDSTQMEIYNETARPIVDAVLEGYNGMYMYMYKLELGDSANITIMIVDDKNITIVQISR